MGLAVGAFEGFAVGTFVGPLLGLRVGPFVGPFVGATVGVAVGADDFAHSCRSDSSRPPAVWFTCASTCK